MISRTSLPGTHGSIRVWSTRCRLMVPMRCGPVGAGRVSDTAAGALTARAVAATKTAPGPTASTVAPARASATRLPAARLRSHRPTLSFVIADSSWPSARIGTVWPPASRVVAGAGRSSSAAAVHSHSAVVAMVEAIAGRGYRGLVSSVDRADPPRPGLPPRPADTPRPGRAIRETLHVLAGLPLSITGWTMVVGVPVAVWYWPVWRLMYGHAGYGPLSDWPITPVLLVLAAGLTLLVLPARIRAATRWQRLRFRYLLAVELPPPPPTRAGRPIDRLVREWTTPGTWRQFLYHAVAPLPAAMAAVAVPVCWLLAPPFAPRAAGALADADAAAA